MNKLLLILWLTLWTGINSHAQKNPLKIDQAVTVAPGVVMKTTEVTIQEWMGYIVNNNFDSSLYPDSNCIPNTTKKLFNDLRNKHEFKYLKIVNYSGRMLQNYGPKGIETSKNFKQLVESDTNYFSLDIPMTGISFDQVQAFCQWKEKVLSASSSQEVTVFLPTVVIYQKLINNRDTINSQKCYLQNSLNCNCPTFDKQKNSKWQGACLARADSYFPNDLGLYGLQGNSAEMTNTKGVAMGGSFRHYARESFDDKCQGYSKPEDWLGFRYLVEIN